MKQGQHRALARATAFLSTTLLVSTVNPSLTLAADASGWQEIPLGGETRCADGSPYSIFYHEGKSGKIVLDFMGGGACWNAETCRDGSPYVRKKVPDILGSWIPEADGIYDRSNNANPFRDDTHVIIPYCTGDVHWGSADVDYVGKNGETISISHRGSTNAKAAIDYALTQITTDPSRIFVTGCSAGSYGSIWWTPYIRQLKPSAKTIQMGDSGAGVFTEDFRRSGLPRWNIAGSAPRWVPGLDPEGADLSALDLTDIYSAIAMAHPDVRFSQYNSLNDIVQRWFYGAMGGNQFLWGSQMRASQRQIASATENFTYFISPWDGHCVIPFHDFYGEQKDAQTGLLFPNWIAGLLGESDPVNEPCDGCAEDSPSM